MPAKFCGGKKRVRHINKKKSSWPPPKKKKLSPWVQTWIPPSQKKKLAPPNFFPFSPVRVCITGCILFKIVCGKTMLQSDVNAIFRPSNIFSPPQQDFLFPFKIVIGLQILIIERKTMRIPCLIKTREGVALGDRAPINFSPFLLFVCAFSPDVFCSKLSAGKNVAVRRECNF